MSREIKFNAWNKISNTMHYNITSKENWSFSFLNQDVFEWLQYSGLKDKNGKDIYDGDIINASYGIGKVYFDIVTACFKYEFALDADLLWYYAKDSVIVGNIYEKQRIPEINLNT